MRPPRGGALLGMSTFRIRHDVPFLALGSQSNPLLLRTENRKLVSIDSAYPVYLSAPTTAGPRYAPRTSTEIHSSSFRNADINLCSLRGKPSSTAAPAALARAAFLPATTLRPGSTRSRPNPRRSALALGPRFQ